MKRPESLYYQLIGKGINGIYRLRAVFAALARTGRLEDVSTLITYEIASPEEVTSAVCKMTSAIDNQDRLLFKAHDIACIVWFEETQEGTVCLKAASSAAMADMTPELLEPFCQLMPPTALLEMPATPRQVLGDYVNSAVCQWSQQNVWATQLVGILNVTPDSFSDGGSYYNLDHALEGALTLIEDGASVIDLGGQSTRPDAKVISPQEELYRLEPVLEQLQKLPLLKQRQVKISVDSFYPEVIEKLQKQFDIDWLNDVRGFRDMKMQDIFLQSTKQGIITHTLDVPALTSHTLPASADPVTQIYAWFQERIQALHQKGIPLERMIIDPGLGFGKTPQQSLWILKNIAAFKPLGVKILVGHSRKFFLRFITNVSTRERDAESAFFGMLFLDQGVD